MEYKSLINIPNILYLWSQPKNQIQKLGYCYDCFPHEFTLKIHEILSIKVHQLKNSQMISHACSSIKYGIPFASLFFQFHFTCFPIPLLPNWENSMLLFGYFAELIFYLLPKFMLTNLQSVNNARLPSSCCLVIILKLPTIFLIHGISSNA